MILAVYLLPFLVGRREMTGLSNIEDRYSAELRVLDTGPALAEETCQSSGHAELFRRRPKVRAMNRPAVRNVRALRTERELTRARKAHAQARERRRVAASHRGVVACVLLGVTLGAWVLGLFTALPWWPALVPTALLGVSMAAGHRAARASAASERRETRRIAELERELVGLTGRRTSTAVVAQSLESQQGKDSKDSMDSMAEMAELRQAALAEAIGEPQREQGRSVGREESDLREARVDREGAVASAGARSEESAASALEIGEIEELEPSETSVAAAGDEPSMDAEIGEPAWAPSQQGAEPAGADEAGETGEPAARASRRPRTSEFLSAAMSFRASSPAWSQIVPRRKAHEDAGAVAAAVEAGPERATASVAGGAGSEPREPAAERVEVQEPAPVENVPAAEQRHESGVCKASRSTGSTSTDKSTVKELTTATPPQGWHPIKVPAPTYTLAARAPRRAYAEPVVQEHASAPVPARPQTVRTFTAPDFAEQDFQPIDLDAILERRRAAGE
ncbi:hypothetical protein [Actinomyces slackii]|uniref:hypothetical protein n=1 Tax=Actinomyces slackii TaxID=52774 RepID=UPI001E416A1C|nr:hypothetical protein [Actinomyces slackii]